MDQRDTMYQDQFNDCKDGLEKACQGRTVLHKKVDDIEIKLEKIQPTIEQGKVFFGNVSKIMWGIAGLVFIAILANSLPTIIEGLK